MYIFETRYVKKYGVGRGGGADQKKKKNKNKYVRLLGDASKILWQNCKDSDQAGSTHFF